MNAVYQVRARWEVACHDTRFFQTYHCERHDRNFKQVRAAYRTFLCMLLQTYLTMVSNNALSLQFSSCLSSHFYTRKENSYKFHSIRPVDGLWDYFYLQSQNRRTFFTTWKPDDGYRKHFLKSENFISKLEDWTMSKAVAVEPILIWPCVTTVHCTRY
jgi:hypothetical protein